MLKIEFYNLNIFLLQFSLIKYIYLKIFLISFIFTLLKINKKILLIIGKSVNKYLRIKFYVFNIFLLQIS